MEKQKCKCEWCYCQPVRSGKGYCRRHYDQIRKYGHVINKRNRNDDNEIIIKDVYAEMLLHNDRGEIQGITKISIEDIERVKGYHWTDNGKGYVRTFVNNSPLYLHRYLTNCPDGLEVDHINRDKSDNRRENLRIVSHSVNKANNDGKCVRLITNRHLKKPYFVSIIRKGYKPIRKYFETEIEATKFVDTIKKEMLKIRMVDG